MLARVFQWIRKYAPFTKIVPIKITTVKNELLKGKTALIFGGCGGIGLGIAQAFTEAGCKVILTGRDEKKLLSVCERIHDSQYVVLDVLDVDGMSEKIDELIQSLAEHEKIDIMVYSAGIHGGSDFSKITVKEYDSVMNINMRGMFFACQKIADYMKKNKISGHILTISSASEVKPAWSPYEISKWAVKGFTLGLARELIPYGIVVNSIAPGPVATQMLNKQNAEELNWAANPAGRLAMPEEVGALAVFLAADTGNYIVGDSIFISGGSGNLSVEK
ncbi:MAG: SDR family oxidoreductase [Lachnospiraceae bacterium]|nr:SDR family oxidoreductase [Lachnospiraceae bacterium]